MDVAEAFALVSHALDLGRVPGGYLVVGDVKGGCQELVERLLAKLFPEAREQIRNHCHPDVAFLEPEGKSRTIKTETLRTRLVEPMASTSFSGGWKVGVISGADRLQPAAANAFLKSLEEPTPRTLFLLLTDRPEGILPTIVSRCQRIDLPMSAGLLDGDAAERIAAVFTAKGLATVFARAQAAHFLAELLAELKDAAENEDVALVRKAFYQTVMSHVRGWMVSGALPRASAFRNIEAVEEAYARSERHLPDDAVLCFMMDKITFPAA